MRPVGSAHAVPAMAKPHLAPVTAAGRRALHNHIVNVLFNKKNPAGQQFRDACVAWRTPAEQAKFKASMLKEAASWSPTAPGWEKGTLQGFKDVYSGRLGQLYTEVRFPEGKGKPSVYVEID